MLLSFYMNHHFTILYCTFSWMGDYGGYNRMNPQCQNAPMEKDFIPQSTTHTMDSYICSAMGILEFNVP